MSSKATSRIPTFRSKVPQLPSPSTTQQISSKDIGKRVRAVEKEGVLRYIGNVHFAAGVWCGIELSTSSGKNDGVVQGIRYFTCSPKCGLMAPQSKVTLIEHNYDNLEDGASGPYSMLFIDSKEELSRTYVFDRNNPEIGSNQHFTIEDINESCNTTLTEPPKKRLTYIVNRTNPEVVSNFSFGDIQEIQRTLNKSSENLFINDKIDVSRRRTVEKPASLPQLKNFDPPSTQSYSTFTLNNKFSYATPGREFEDNLLRKLQLTSTPLDDESSKRDSLEFEESLGILTPEQMAEGMSFLTAMNTTELIDKIEKTDLPSPMEAVAPPIKIDPSNELPSPNVVDASITDFSLGIIDEQLLSNLTQKTDTTMNMELPLDTLDKSKNYALTRLEQTPSPEDLPLDPTPIIESDPKTEPTKSKTSSSFITSITSITSLDTGYQGDGEMSRPASRGADNSPLTRRPLPRPQTRRPDPMTDSDFYTESDADNHEDNPLRGDRRAQVIDGTLYGVDPQAAADIYANNRENMDSSGIFTDIETNTRNDDQILNETIDVSPSDTSTKTISGNSQNNIQQVLDKTMDSIDLNTTVIMVKENPKKRNAPSPGISSPSSSRSPRHNKEENASKKYKMPKREVTSKVKAMLETMSPTSAEKKTINKKPVGRWDAVMNKISKTEQTKTNLKDVKSKVFNSVNVMNVQRQSELRKTGVRQPSNLKSPNIKARRVRARTGSTNSTPKNNIESSIHSSLSDLSASVATPKTSSGSTKKRDVVPVTQVLTASKLSARPTAQTPAENKKPTGPASSPTEPKCKRPLLAPKEKKQPPVKECGKATVKGGRTSPAVRPPVHTRSPPKPPAPRVAEGLAVLVQHLVFNVKAYNVPALEREVQKFRHEAEEIRLAFQQLEEALAEERTKKIAAIEEERLKSTNEIEDLVEKHKSQIEELNNHFYVVERRLIEENETNKTLLARQNEEKLMKFKVEFEKLQKTHEESLDILREENDSIREQIDEKNVQIEEIKHESLKLKEDYEAKEMKLKEQLQNVKCENQKLKQELSRMDVKYEEKMRAVYEENSRLREENDKLLSYSDNKGMSIKEVQSLRVVLELKQDEVSELRRALAEASRKNEVLAGAEEKAAILNAKCEDLQLQLQRKSECEQNLITENKKLQDSFKEEINQKKRLRQYNEELQWKLKQNKEVVTKVLEQAAEESAVFNRSMLSSSFNERHANAKSLERTLSFRENKNSPWKSRNNDESLSPPSSPKVKGVVEKSDWVSYVLDLDESPEVVASRMIRRSFRNSTPPKTTPTKSPDNKRPREKNPLSLSASASALLAPTKTEYCRSRSLSNRNGDEDVPWMMTTSTPKRVMDDLDLDLDEDMDMKLPALPSEIGRKNGAQALPSPKHLAGEALISESNSEDESSSSSFQL